MRHLLSTSIWIVVALPLAAQDIPLSKILVEKEGWREVAKGFSKVNFLEPEAAGSIRIYQEHSQSRLRADGKLEKEMLRGSESRGLMVRTKTDRTYYIKIYRNITRNENTSNINPNGNISWEAHVESPKNTFLYKVINPTCLTLWPDEGHLVIGEADGAYLWAVRLEKDGSFGPGDRYYSLRTRPGEKMHVTAMTMDAGYLLYACTPLGIQVFDPTGRLSGVIAAPAKETMTAITVGGPGADNLYVAAGERIYARKIQGKAIYTLKQAK
jgi:gluconolactonase